MYWAEGSELTWTLVLVTNVHLHGGPCTGPAAIDGLGAVTDSGPGGGAGLTRLGARAPCRPRTPAAVNYKSQAADRFQLSEFAVP